MNRVCHLVAFCGAMIVCSQLPAQEAPSFQEAVAHFAQSREKLQSYSVYINAKVKEQLKPVRLSNGTTVEPTEELTGYKLDVIVDKKSKSRLIYCKTERRGVDGNVPTSPTAKLVVYTPNYTIRAQGTRGSIQSGSSPRSCCDYSMQSMPAYDPLTIGFGFGGDISRGESWERVCENYRGWRERPQESLQDGVIRYGYFDEKTPDFIEMDSKKGFVPTRLQTSSRQMGIYAVDVRLKSVDGHWLPESAKITSKDRVEELTFSWADVNGDVSGLFSKDAVEGRFGLTIRESRR